MLRAGIKSVSSRICHHCIRDGFCIKKQISPRMNTDQEKPKPLKHGGMEVAEKKNIYRGFARMSVDQKQNSNCSFWCCRSLDHEISISVIRGKGWVLVQSYSRGKEAHQFDWINCAVAGLFSTRFISAAMRTYPRMLGCTPSSLSAPAMGVPFASVRAR